MAAEKPALHDIARVLSASLNVHDAALVVAESAVVRFHAAGGYVEYCVARSDAPREASAESVLEYLPDPIIPFRDSRYYAGTELTVHPAASVIVGDLLLPGRVAHGEHHDYTLYASRLTVRSPEGALWFTDALELAPRHRPLHSPGRLGPHAVLATLYVVSRQLPGRALADRLHERVAALPGVLGGASELPNGCGAWARVLGATSSAVSAALHAVWDEARLAVLGVPAPNRRKS